MGVRAVVTPERQNISFRGRGAVLAAVLAGATPAWAGSFGGFSADESRYLVGADLACAPLGPGDAGAPRCTHLNARALARAGFDKPAPIPAGRFRVDASGTRLTVRDGAGKVLREWKSLGVISHVDAVYASPHQKLLAVEYTTRTMGRVSTDVIGFAVRSSRPAPAPKSSSPPASAPQPAAPEPEVRRVERPGALASRLKKAQGLLRHRRYAPARRSFEALARANPADAAILYGLAASKAGAGDTAGAIAELRKLGALDHPEVPIWFIQARIDHAFDALRRNLDFRKVVGIDPGGRVLSAYERALALGGRWEQPGTPCSEPTIDLALEAARQTFRLVIHSKCQGLDDRTQLGGTWRARGKDVLELVFPNPGQKDELFECKLQACQSGGETCMRCGENTDMAFTVRPVRR